MSPPSSSPATTFHDVLVTEDQTGSSWSARGAVIVAGAIEVTFTKLPPELLASPSHTFTITAADGGYRRRTFSHVIVDHARTKKMVAVFT